MAEAAWGLAVDRITLVELIEDETAKLSPRGKELWEEMETLVDLSPEEQVSLHERTDIVNRRVLLSPLEQGVLDRLMELRAGLYESDRQEERGESGEGHRVRSVIQAAKLKDISEGRHADPDMTVEQAVARLRQ
jgi:hypothetical protein